MNFEICKKCIDSSIGACAFGDFSDCKKFFDVYGVAFTLKESYYHQCVVCLRLPLRFPLSDIYDITANQEQFFNFDSDVLAYCRECFIIGGLEFKIFDKIDIDCVLKVGNFSGSCPYVLDHQVHYWSLEQ